MDATTGAIIAQAGASAANSAGSFLSNMFFGERNEEWAREDATTAYERQRQLIDEQRAYDSPKAQMQRFIDAGLNPNLIYGQMDSSSPMIAPQAKSASTSPAQFGLSIPVLESELMQAEIDRIRTQNANDTDLTSAQTYHLYKITDAEYQRITNDAKRLQQVFESNEYKTLVEQLKAESFKDGGLFTFEGSDGEDITTDFKSLIFENEVSRLYASNREYELAIKTFLNRVGLSNYDLSNAALENKDLQAFVDVCARIYEGEAKQSDYIGSIAELNKDFYDSMGAAPELVKLVYGFLNMILNGVVGFRSSRKPSSNRRTDVYYHTDY